jgi:hypothetical protein
MRCDRELAAFFLSKLSFQLGYRKFNRPLEQGRIPVLTLRASADLERTEGISVFRESALLRKSRRSPSSELI